MNPLPTLPVTRPKSLLVFGILNLALGAYSAVTSVPGMFMMFNPGKYAGNPAIRVMQDDHVFAIFQKAMVVPGLLSVFALIASGIGLVKAREWGRKLAILCSWYMIVALPLASWMIAVHLYPTMLKQIIDQTSKQGGPAGATEIMVVTMKVVTAATVVLFVAYYILQIVMLSRTKVQAYCGRLAQAPAIPSAL
jgi:hypothetical protein